MTGSEGATQNLIQFVLINITLLHQEKDLIKNFKLWKTVAKIKYQAIYTITVCIAAKSSITATVEQKL